MNNLVYLGLSILEISKIVLYEFWYDFVKPGKIMLHKNRQLYSVHKTEGIYVAVTKDIETKFDTSN